MQGAIIRTVLRISERLVLPWGGGAVLEGAVPRRVQVGQLLNAEKPISTDRALVQPMHGHGARVNTGRVPGRAVQDLAWGSA